MCGIVGYIGDEPAAPVLLDGLSKLEYRGYDSAGIAIYSNGALKVAKAKGRLQVLADMLKGGTELPGTAGIGHTRWATHGEPSDVNAHPHVSDSGKIAVVHNGIIENYMKIRDYLTEKGIKFVSDTDTEAVAQLIGYYYKGDILEAVAKAVRSIEGSYSLGVICSDFPDRLVAARKDSPLIIGYGDGCNFLASDVPAILKYTREVTYLDNGDLAVLTKDSVKYYDINIEPLEKEIRHIDWDISAAEKCGYEHFMFKEILEQPKAISDTVAPHIKDGKVVLDGVPPSIFEGLEKICIIACGSSYHVGVIGKYTIEKMVRKPVEVILGSEFRYCDPLVDGKTLVIAISQSGQTADTIEAMREAKRKNARTLSIVNVIGSTIAAEADAVVYTLAGPEIAVATTKAYSTQLAVIYLIALYLADLYKTIGENEYNEILNGLKKIPDKIEDIFEGKDRLQYLASLYFNNDDVFFIGRNIDYAMCLEGSLKLKEISYIHSEAYAAGELKHGTISLVEKGTLVIAVATYSKLFGKVMSNVEEVRARGAEVLAFTLEKFRGEAEKIADDTFCIPDIHEILLPSLSVIPLQLFAYYVAALRGCDIDKPRNLAKSVTVE